MCKTCQEYPQSRSFYDLDVPVSDRLFSSTCSRKERHLKICNLNSVLFAVYCIELNILGRELLPCLRVQRNICAEFSVLQSRVDHFIEKFCDLRIALIKQHIQEKIE